MYHKREFGPILGLNRSLATSAFKQRYFLNVTNKDYGLGYRGHRQTSMLSEKLISSHLHY